MSKQIKYWHVTYNDIHNLIRKVSPKIAADFNPDLLIAIGSFQPPLWLTCYSFSHCRGRVGHRSRSWKKYFPNFSLQRFLPCARYGELPISDLGSILIIASKRTFLREQTTNKTLQIQAIGLSLYEPVEGVAAEQLGIEVIRTQWLYVETIGCCSRI